MKCKKELLGFLEKQLNHYDITKGYISDCLDTFEEGQYLRGLKENVNVDVDLEIKKSQVRLLIGKGEVKREVEKHKFQINLGIDGRIYVEIDDAKRKDKKKVYVVFGMGSIVEESYKLLLKKGYIKK